MPFSSSLHCCRRVDLTSPALIFGGLFVAATAVCGAMDASSSPAGVVIEEVQVARGELSAGPNDIDLVAVNCERETKPGAKSKSHSSSHVSFERRCDLKLKEHDTHNHIAH